MIPTDSAQHNQDSAQPKKRRYHLHVYQTRMMFELELEATTPREAKAKALDLVEAGEGDGEVGKWHLPDQPYIVVSFEDGYYQAPFVSS
jgi:hypothetical protein